MNYTHYDYLELAPGATAKRIEAAYAALLERFQYGTTDAGQDLSGLVRMIHAAYEVLSDPETRKAYDASCRRRPPQPTPSCSRAGRAGVPVQPRAARSAADAGCVPELAA